jgi:hypothetical protein
MRHFNRIIQATLLLALTALLMQGRAHAGAPADAVPVDITGELTVLYMDDFENKRAELQYFIEDKQSKRRYRLQFDGTPPGHLRSGATVKVRGKAKGREIILAADGTSEQGVEIISPAAVIVAGEQKTLVIGANLKDRSLNCSAADISNLMFTDANNQSVDDLYQETSFGNVWLTGQVAGNYTINYSTTDVCDISAWANAAEAAALADGINVAAYPRKVYVLPPNSCPASGYGTVGGNASRSWIFTCDLPDVFAHELGHNLGMQHAATPSYTYGDTSDIMGLGGGPLRHVNAPHKEQLGWLADAPAQVVTQSGSYDVAPLELSSTTSLAPRALKVFKADSNEYYFLSYRRPIGFDTNLSSTYLDKLSVHKHAGDGNSGTTYLLAKLADGESFTDTANGITVTQLSHNNDYVTVEVTLDGSDPTPTCNPGTPQVSLSPASQSANAGSTLNYSVSIINTDNSVCANSTFALNDNIPSGWTGTLSPASLSLAPGQIGTAVLSVTSTSSATASTYNVGVNVTDGSAAIHSASGSGSYTVTAACAIAAPTLSLSPGSQSADPGTTLTYSVSLNNNDSSACSASTFNLTRILPGWSGSVSPNSLTLSPGGSGTATLQVTSLDEAAPGSYPLQVTASDTQEAVHYASKNATYVVNETAQADTVAPTEPSGLAASANTKQVSLTWNPSSDNVGVAGYRVYRNGVAIASTVDTGYTDRDGASGVTYEYTVDAYDAANNASAKSPPVMAGKAKAKAKGQGGGKGKGPNK